MSFVTFVTNSTSACMYKFTIVTIFVLRVMCFFPSPMLSYSVVSGHRVANRSTFDIRTPRNRWAQNVLCHKPCDIDKPHVYSAGHTNNALKTMFNT